jgi:hypothetical protein
MPTTDRDLISDAYFRRRLDLLIFPSFLINVYYAFFLFVSYRYPLFVGSERSHLITAISAQAALLTLLPFVGYAGVIWIDVLRIRSQARTWNLLILVVCTFLVIMTATLPVFFWGGSRGSIFSPLMLTDYLVAIVITRSAKLKIIFSAAATCSFTLLSVFYYDVVINPAIVWFRFTGIQIYTLLYLGSVVVGLCIALSISWQTAVLTIFDESDR